MHPSTLQHLLQHTLRAHDARALTSALHTGVDLLEVNGADWLLTTQLQPRSSELTQFLIQADIQVIETQPLDFHVGRGLDARRAVAAHAIIFALSSAIHLNQTATYAGLIWREVEALAQTHAANAILSAASSCAALNLGAHVFALMRHIGDALNARVICLTNVSHEDQLISPDWRALLGTRNAIHNLLTRTRFNVHGPSILLRPYQTLWATV
jgi:hypothetical protein